MRHHVRRVDVSVRQANADARGIAERLQQLYPDTNRDRHYDHGDVSTRDMNGYAGYHNLFAQFGVDDSG